MFIGVAVLVGSFLLASGGFALPTQGHGTGLAIGYDITWITLGTQWGVTQMEAGRSSIIIVMELVVAVISASLWYGDMMSGMEILGALLMMVAVVLEGARDAEVAKQH